MPISTQSRVVGMITNTTGIPTSHTLHSSTRTLWCVKCACVWCRDVCCICYHPYHPYLSTFGIAIPTTFCNSSNCFFILVTVSFLGDFQILGGIMTQVCIQAASPMKFIQLANNRCCCMEFLNSTKNRTSGHALKPYRLKFECHPSFLPINISFAWWISVVIRNNYVYGKNYETELHTSPHPLTTGPA